MELAQLSNRNLSLETTRKKSLQVMQKGIISYKLSCNGWDVSDHYGDGYDLLCINTSKKTPRIIQLELKGVDINYSETSPGFSQSISQNEISTASHLIVSLFDGTAILGHYIMTLNQMFIKKITKTKTSKFSKYVNFMQYREDAIQVTKKKIMLRKGQNRDKNKLPRLDIDIGCTSTMFKNNNWFLSDFLDQWDNLMLDNNIL